MPGDHTAGAAAHYASEVATHGAEREGLHWPIGATTRTGRAVTTDRPGRPISRGARHRHRIPQSAPGRVTRRTI
jgi:hypothetical protein